MSGKFMGPSIVELYQDQANERPCLLDLLEVVSKPQIAFKCKAPLDDKAEPIR